MKSADADIAIRTLVPNGRSVATRHELPKILIGKDILELVSSAMYTDPMTVYREYIQNAADAVDSARNSGQLLANEAGRVDIWLDPTTRTVRIRDNGCGLPFQNFGRKLIALGGSEKRGSSTRGFRGVGRLAGLAYARQLIFRSRVPGEKEVSELVWDCRQLKAEIREAPYDYDVVDLIRSVTSLQRVADDIAPQRFFEVEMRGLVRLSKDPLTNPAAISDYLSQTAPVPFSPTFRFGAAISKALAQHIDLGELHIRVGETDEPIYKPYRDSSSVNGSRKLKFEDLAIIEVPSLDEGVAAVAWVLHHEYLGAIPTGALVKGLRLRTGNIQVGGHALLEDIFPEPRFNSWTVGEVHVVDKRIVPNGRRDHFEQNGHLNNLLNHLVPAARDISRRCRASSSRRRWEREFERLAQSAVEGISIIVQGSIARSKKDQLALDTKQTLVEMCRIATKSLLAETADERHRKIQDLREQLTDATNDDAVVSMPLGRFSEAERKSYERFFGLVYECSVNRASAKALIDRMLLKIT